MGWLFIYGSSKQDIIRERSKDWENDKVRSTCLAKTIRGNVFWSVRAHTNKETGETFRFIACDLLGSDPTYGWGYKDMEESMHPYYYSCPLKYLEMVPEQDGVTCPEWREQVREYHRCRSIRLHVGDRVRLRAGSQPPELTITSLKPLRGIYNYVTYRLSRRLIAEVLPANTSVR